MATVDSLSDDHWAKTEDVQEVIDIPNKGSERDFENAIERATDSVQAWWKRETGDNSLPDASNLDSLLVQATAYMAAHEAHFSKAWQFSGDDNTSPASAKSEAKDKFEEWASTRDVEDTEASREGETVDHTVERGSLVDEF